MPGRKAGEDLARSQGPLRGDENHFKIRRIALRSISGRNAGKGSCRDARPGKASGDARLAKTTPGRNARKTIRGRKAAFGRKLRT